MQTGQVAKKDGYSLFKAKQGIGLLVAVAAFLAAPSDMLLAALEQGAELAEPPSLAGWTDVQTTPQSAAQSTAQATPQSTPQTGGAVVPPVRREKPQTPPDTQPEVAPAEAPVAEPARAAAGKTEPVPEEPHVSGILGVIQEWLARASREYQSVVVKELSLPPSSGPAEDEIAKKLKEQEAEEARKAAEAQKADDRARRAAEEKSAEEKAAADAKAQDAKAQDAKALDEDRKRAEQTKRLADDAKKKADELFKAGAENSAEPQPAAPNPDETARRAEQERLEAQKVRDEAKRQDEQRKADEARRAEEQRRKADAAAEAERRRAAEAAAATAASAEKHRTRTIQLSTEPIARPADTATRYRPEYSASPPERSDEMHVAEATAGTAQPRRFKVFREATYRGTAVKRWVWRDKGRHCSAAGRRVTPPARYTIKRGDSLWRISARHYNAGRLYKKIFRANRSRIADPDLIYPCQRVLVPR